MKTLYQLEQEAKEARDNAIFLHGSESPLSQDIVDSIINAAVAMVTYQFACAENLKNGVVTKKTLVGENCNEHCSKETGSDQAAFSLGDQIEMLKKANSELSFKLEELKISGDGSGKALPEVSQEEKDGIIGERKPKLYGNAVNIGVREFKGIEVIGKSDGKEHSLGFFSIESEWEGMTLLKNIVDNSELIVVIPKDDERNICNTFLSNNGKELLKNFRVAKGHKGYIDFNTKLAEIKSKKEN